MNQRKLRHKETIIVQKQTELFNMKFTPKKCFKNKQKQNNPRSIIDKLKSIVVDNRESSNQQNLTNKSSPSQMFKQIKFIVKLTSQKNYEQDLQQKQKNQQANQVKKSASKQKTKFHSEVSFKSNKSIKNSQENNPINLYESWVQYVLIGNQNQIDLLKVQLKNGKISKSIEWSLNLEEPIKGVQKCKYSESKLILWTQHKVYVYSYDKKNILLSPKQIKHFQEKKFLKRNIFIVCFRDGAKIYELYDIGSVVSLDKHFQKTFEVPQSYNVFSIPELIENQVKIFYIYNNQKEEQPTFRLYFISLEHFFEDIVISDFKKVYDFKKGLQKQIKIHNFSKAIFLVNLRSEIIAIKNGMIIDNMNVNFKGNNLFLKIISRNKIVHFLEDKLEIYKFGFNLTVMPQKLQIHPVDSISFQRDFNSIYLSAIQFKFGYGIFFQRQIYENDNLQSQKAVINYWIGVTVGVELKDKLDSIFPSKCLIQDTKFQILQQKCDMAMKMGLTQDQSYLQLWKRSKQQSDKDFDILMSTKTYGTVINQIILKMKKSSMKFRLLKKIETMCCDMLRQRIYNQHCSFQSIRQYASSHFLLLKLQVFKDIQVETKRFRKQQYTKKIKPNQEKLKGILSFIQSKKTLSPKHNVSPKNSLKKNISQKIFTNFFNNNLQNEIKDKQKEIKEKQKEINDRQNEKQQIESNPFAGNIFLGAFFPVKEDLKQQIHGNTVSDLRKIQTITQIQNTTQQNDQVKISIKDYYLYRDCHLKQHFMSIIFDFMGSQYVASDHLKIFSLRAFLRIFRLQFRLCYEQVLMQVLQVYKTNIKKLLQNFPQFLPYKCAPENDQENLYYGIWNSIQKRQMQSNLFADDIITIQNKQIVSQFIKNIWYKRNHNSHHSVITHTKNQIIEKYSQSKMQQLHNHFFYLFYSKILQLKRILQSSKKSKKDKQQTKQDNSLKLKEFFFTTVQLDKYDQIIKYVQIKYQISPKHLKGKIFLYQNLFYYLKNFNKKTSQISLYDFLQLQDFQLFQIFFKVEKQKQGFLIKSILPLYKKITQNGKEDFIQGINSFFRSDKSQVTDLKTILNRLNNQKAQFHNRFQRLYGVLIEAIMEKIKVGTGNDIPIQQLLIYIQNIPFSVSKTKTIQNMLFIQEVQYEIELLSQAKLNMSIKQIQQKPEQVITALVRSQLQKFQVIQSKDEEDIKMCFYKIISEIQSLKGHLYGDQLQNFSSFVFITQLIVKKQLIPAIKSIMRDQFVIENFQIDYNFRKSVVFYAIKRHMAKNQKKYLQSKQYVLQVLSFLPSEDKDRKFIQNEIKYCQIFFKCNYYLPYPLSLSKSIPNIHQIQYHVRRIEASQLQKLDIKAIYQTFESLRNLLEPQIDQDPIQIQLKKKQFFKELFQITFLRFLKQKKFKQAIKIIQKIMFLNLDSNIIIYPILLIDMIFPEITQKSQCILAELVSYFFYQGQKLTEIIKHLISYPHNSKQFDDYVLKQIKGQIKYKKIIAYNKKNFLIRPEILRILKDQQNLKYQKAFSKLIEYSLVHLVRHDECLQKNKSYNLIYRIICHQPFLAVKFIYLRQQGFNLKIFRQFLSFLSSQIIFQPLSVLKYGKFAMEILLNKAKSQCSLDKMIQQYQRHEINSIKDDFNFLKEALNQKELIIYNSVQVMNKKIKYFQESNLNLKIEEMHQNAIQNHQQYNQGQSLQLSTTNKNKSFSLLQYPRQIQKMSQFKYMYHCDQDDVYANREKQQIEYFQINKWADQIQFDDFNQRHKIHVCRKNSLFSQLNCNMRMRKKSAYLPESFRLQVTPKKNISSLKVCEQHVFSNFLTRTISQIASPNFLNIPYQKNDLIKADKTDKQQQQLLNKSDSGKILQDSDFLNSSMGKYKIGNISTINHNRQISPQEMKNQIFGIVNQIQPILDLSELNQIKKSKRVDFNKYTTQVCKLIYQSEQKPIKFRVCIINQILNNFNCLNLKFNILKIFLNASKLKFINSLDLPFTYLFPFQNLFSKEEKKDQRATQKDQMKLFKNVKDKIMKNINGLNVKHFSQMVLYAFGKNSYHDQIYYQYMLKVIEESMLKYKNLNQFIVQGGSIVQKLAFLIHEIIDMDYFKINLQELKSGNAEDFQKFKIFNMGIQKKKQNETEEDQLQNSY